MGKYMDLNSLDELFLQLHRCAEMIEKLMNNTRVTGETIISMAGIVADSRHELIVLLSLKNKESMLGDRRINIVLDLAERYEHLEGVLKEMRNDLQRREILANQTRD